MKTLLPHNKTVRFMIGLSLCFMQSVVVNAQTVHSGFRAPAVQDDAYYYTAVQTPDRKILLAGEFNWFGTTPVEGSIVKLTTSGSLDRTFQADYYGSPDQLIPFRDGATLILDDGELYWMSRNGNEVEYIEAFDGDVEAIEVLEDFSMLIVADGYLKRYSSDFEEDESFGGPWIDGYVYDIALQGDKILLAGEFEGLEEYGTEEEYGADNIARLHADGSVDEEFSRWGATEEIRSLVVQPDGKIILGNTIMSIFDGESTWGEVIRLNADGTYDDDFETGAYFAGNVRYDRGKITVASAWNGGVVRLKDDGSVDPTFSQIWTDDYYEGFNAFFLSGGDILLLNGKYDEYTSFGLEKYSAAGRLARSFKPAITTTGDIYDMTVIDDKVMIAGDFTHINGQPARNLARLRLTGSLDRTFDYEEDDGYITELESFSNGSLLVYNAWYGWHKLRRNGDFDENFSFESSAYVGGSGTLYQAKVVNDKIYFSSSSPYYAFGVRNADGSIGEFEDIYHNGYYGYSSFAVQPDGKIVFAGDFNTINGVASKNVVRYNPDGTLDGTFDVGSGHNGYYLYNGVTVLTDGGILVEGNFSAFNGTSVNNYVVKLDQFGAVDQDFLANMHDEPLDNWWYNEQAIPFREGYLKYMENSDNNEYTLQHVRNDGTATDREDLLPSEFYTDGPPVIAVVDDRTMYLGGYVQVDNEWRSLVRINLRTLRSVDNSDSRMAVEPSYTVFPNPSVDFLSFDTDRPAKIRITSPNGNITMDADITSAEDKVNVSSLEPGRYIIHVNIEGKTRALHFVKK